MQDMRLIRSFGLAVLLAGAPLTAHAQRELPKGWLGVLITTGIGEANNRGTLIFNDYPVIESIDPGSPAEKAGLMAGDILISINKQDFKKNPIPMGSLLKPGQKVVFRYRRDNVAKTITMVVAERPAGSLPRIDYTIIGPDLRMRGSPADEGLLRGAGARIPGAPRVRIPPLVFRAGPTSIGVAGAELTQLNDGWRETLNLKGDGIVVVNVAMPSIAADAGLRSGDVITRVEKQLVQNPGELIELMMQAKDNSLLLQILRKQKEQNITLRW
jgi:serine protease Do